MKLFKPKDFIALLTVMAIFGLVIVKANHGFDAVLAMIIGYYFARRDEPDHVAIENGK